MGRQAQEEREMIEYKGHFDRETMMEQWDTWARYFRDGEKGSWPRDAFEALLDYFEERLASRTDLDLPLAGRTQANMWKAMFWEMRAEVVKANKGNRRLNKKLARRCIE